MPGGCCWCAELVVAVGALVLVKGLLVAGAGSGAGGCWCWSKSWWGLWWGMLAGCCCWSMLVLLVSQLRLVKCWPISSVVVFAQFSEV
jgi:hypothetical protein